MRIQLYGCLVMIVASAAAVSTGCESAQKTGSLEDAVSDYDAGRYDEAQETAESLIESGGSDRDEAAYIAGLTAYKQGHLVEAADHFDAAMESRDELVASRSRAMLGVIRLDQGRPAEAATLLSDAAKDLEGEEAEEAARHAAKAYAAAGNPLTGSRWRSASSASGTSGATGLSVPSSAFFALQVGAFRERGRAETAARSVEPLARRHALGPVKVIPRQDSRGRSLYLVQVGHFPSRNAASTARNRMGHPEYIVATAY